MKAKEYATKYIQSDDKYKVIIDIGKEFLNEITELAETRKVKSDKALVPICKELDQKWIKFAEIVNKKYPASQPIRYAGFRLLIQQASPELYIHIISNKLWKPL